MCACILELNITIDSVQMHWWVDCWIDAWIKGTDNGSVTTYSCCMYALSIIIYVMISDKHINIMMNDIYAADDDKCYIMLWDDVLMVL